ncbi:N-acetyltransferase family protein [Enterococcus olivae]
MNNLFIRKAKREDAEALLQIYAPYVNKTTITFEYEVPSTEEFAQRIEQTLPRYPYLIAESAEGEILGYAYAGAYKTRAAYDWSVETTVYVKENCPVKGVGTRLYTALEEVLKAQNIYQLIACITAGNAKSVGFHQKLGYREVGVFPQVGFKFDQWCDVLWMQKTILEEGGKPSPMIPFSEIDLYA